jgi:hypothetical protein
LHHLGYHSDIVEAVDAYWSERFKQEPSLRKEWIESRKTQRRLARALYGVGIGQDGKPSAVSRNESLVSKSVLCRMRMRNNKRLEEADKTTSRVRFIQLRFRILNGVVIWRSNTKEALIGCAAGNKRADGRCMIDTSFAGNQLQLSTAAIAWVLQTKNDLPSKYKVRHLDGNKSNIALANIHIV